MDLNRQSTSNPLPIGRTRGYTDLFLDFDDTLYDTRGNAIIAQKELYDGLKFKEHFVDEQTFYDIYWKTNVELWAKYSHGEIEREYLIVERFRRPLAAAQGAGTYAGMAADDSWPSPEYCLKVSDRFLDLCSVKPGVVDGAHELMDYLRSRGYRCHICSNGFHEVQYKKLRASGLLEYFDTIILSEDAGVNKPQRAFFDYALRTSGAKAETTLMIGDNYNTDIIGAMGAGIDTMLFNRWDASFVPPQPVNYTVNTLREIMTIL